MSLDNSLEKSTVFDIFSAVSVRGGAQRKGPENAM
jgi:hypothetical protein